MMRSTLQTGVIVTFAALALGGCRAETFGDADLPIDPSSLLVEGVRLPGGTVTLSAPWLAGALDSIAVSIDGGAVFRIGRSPGEPTKFVLPLPTDLAGGSHDLLIRQGDGALAQAGTLTTGGFSELRYALGSFAPTYGMTQPLPDRMMVASTSFDASRTHTALLDVRAAQIRLLATSNYCCYGLGASYLPASFLTYQNGAPNWLRLSITPTGVVTESLPSYGIWWPKHELAPGLFLADEKQQTWFEDDLSVTSQNVLDYHHPYRIAFSADGHWAVASHESSTQGALIVDRTTRSYHWSPGWFAYTRPLFLPDGRLVLYGWRRDPTYDPATYGPNGEYLAHVDPATGALLDSVRFADAGSPYDQPVALSSGLIVMPSMQQSRVEISFRDPNTLLEVGHARSPESSLVCDFNTLTTLEEPGLHRIYLSGDACPSGVPIWTFTLPE